MSTDRLYDSLLSLPLFLGMTRYDFQNVAGKTRFDFQNWKRVKRSLKKAPVVHVYII